MILYHTSYMVVEQPDLEHSRDYLDFGKGFYLTSLRHQAVLYSERFFLRGRQAFLGEYDLSDAYVDLSIKTFEAYDEEWLDFVFQCRKGEDKSEYDIVIGGIADDKIFKTIDLYFTGDISKDEALRRLKYEKPNNQYCLRTQRAIDLLTFKSAEEIIK
jgi:hypothetical protein